MPRAAGRALDAESASPEAVMALGEQYGMETLAVVPEPSGR